MRWSEVRELLSSFVCSSTTSFVLSREATPVSSRERAEIEAADDGRFRLWVESGGGERKEIVFSEGVLYLKNTNGRWRHSRDPTGERTALFDDAASAWPAIFPLVADDLAVVRKGRDTWDGRAVVVYSLSLPDRSVEARAQGLLHPMLPSANEVDAGPGANEREAAVLSLTRGFREQVFAAGGRGELWVDEQTGAPVHVVVSAALAIADSPDVGHLSIEISSSLHGIGSPVDIQAPKDAAEEFVRRKMPTSPRAFFEERGLLPRLPPSPSEKTPSSPSTSPSRAPAVEETP
jgi:hypothetical protein